MNKKNDFEKLKKKIASVLEGKGIKKAGIFGSYVRGDQKKYSDVDVLIQPTKKMSLLDFIEIKLELQSKVGQKIDLLSYNGIHPMLKWQILGEEVRIL